MIPIVAALLGNPDPSVTLAEERLSEAEWGRPYAERAKAHLDVRPEEGLSAVTSRAVEEFRLRFPDGDFQDAGILFAFFEPGDEDGIGGGWGRISPVVTLVDELDRATWNQPAESTRYAELLRAAQAGALRGDPTRPYVVLSPPHGDGVLGTWQDVVNALSVFWQWVNNVYSVGETATGIAGQFLVGREVYKLVQRWQAKRAANAPEVIDRYRAEWEARGGRPPDVGAFLDQRPRSTEEVSRLLGCTEDEAATLLRSRGHELSDADGLWHLGTDEAARLLQRVAEVTDWAGNISPEELRERLNRAIAGRDPWGV